MSFTLKLIKKDALVYLSWKDCLTGFSMSKWEAPLEKVGTVFVEGKDWSLWKAKTGLSGRPRQVLVEG